LEKTPLSVNKYRLFFSAWWLLWLLLQVVVLNWLGFSLQVSFIDSAVTNLLLAASCLFVSNNMKYYLPQKERHWYILVLSLVMSGLWLALSRWLLMLVITGNAEYSLFFKKSLPIRFGIAFLLIACMIMMSVVWYALEEQKDRDLRKNETEKLTREAELYKLRQQLQPHFLFNSLNSISALIISNPEHARTMIHQLSDFLRNTLKKDEHEWISLSEELQHLELYLTIEKVRFGHRLTSIIESDENSRQMKLPSMLLQPVLENAIKFGLYDTIGEIIISIQATISDQHLIITIKNPCDHETTSSNQGTGFGLSSVKRRLQLLFARTDLLTTEKNKDQFITTVKIPQHL
jgi:two-component system LytT family sensor kinase